jgi:ABC-2 type transport system permease protein
MYSIFKKEIASFFSSLIGYVAIGLFLLILGLVLWFFPDTSLLNDNTATLAPMFELAPMIFLFLISAVTMRSFAEEKQTGTIELLTTRPLRDLDIVLGKFFASWALTVFALIPTLIYYFSVYQLGSPKGNIDSGACMGSYFGLILLSGVFVSIGVFASSLTTNQIVSFLLAMFLCFFAYWGFGFISKLPIFVGRVDDIVESIGIQSHYQSISRGIVVVSDMVYFVSAITFFVFCTQVSLDSRKW